jgi:hypothetical protein
MEAHADGRYDIPQMIPTTGQVAIVTTTASRASRDTQSDHVLTSVRCQ